LGKLKSGTWFAWGVSEKLSKSCKGNFADKEGGSLGMRLGEVADSPFTGGKIERLFGEREEQKGMRRRKRRRQTNKISRFLLRIRKK